MWEEEAFLIKQRDYIVNWEDILSQESKVVKHIYHSEILYNKLLFSFTFLEDNQDVISSVVTKDWFVSGYHTQNLRYQRQFWALDTVVVQSLSQVQLFASPWTAAHQVLLSFTVSLCSLKVMPIDSDIARTIKYYGLYIRLTCEYRFSFLWFIAHNFKDKSETPLGYGFISFSSKG